MQCAAECIHVVKANAIGRSAILERVHTEMAGVIAKSHILRLSNVDKQ